MDTLAGRITKGVGPTSVIRKPAPFPPPLSFRELVTFRRKFALLMKKKKMFMLNLLTG
jgi:hypothetical protein